MTSFSQAAESRLLRRILFLPAYRATRNIPKDFNPWADILKAFVSHCIERYGREEVKSWYFEVWNEPDNHDIWLKDASTFMALYDYFEDAIHSVDEKIKVGGPAVKQWEGAEKIYREFLEHCARA